MTRSWKLWLAIGALLCGVAVWYVTTRRARSAHAEIATARAEQERTIKASLAAGQKTFAVLDMTPLETFTAPRDLVDHVVAQVEVATSDRRDVRAALEHAAEFLYYRLMQDSPERYRAWRESYGYTMRPISEMGRVDRLYKRIFNRPMPEDDPRTRDDDIVIFDDMWGAILTAEKGKAHPVALASESSGFDIAIGPVDPTFSTLPRLSGELGAETWYGMSGVGFGRNWWRDPAGGILKILQDKGQADVAVVGFILEMEAGDRYPLELTLFENNGKWWIWRINALNVEYGRLLGWEY